MVIILLLLALVISFTLHIRFLWKYIQQRQQRYLRHFINSAVSNVLLAIGTMFLALYKPEYIRKIDFSVFMWLLAGFVLVLMLFIKISIFKRIHRRAQQPEHFHLNYFGKKVLHTTVVTPVDIALFFVTMPFFLFIGAYFVARLINLLMYNHL